MVTKKKARTKANTAAATPKSRRWSGRVTRESNAMDLDPNVFKRDETRSIARSLKHSVEQSHRRKSTPFRSAMSMLNFYINRAGTTLSRRRHQILEKAKEELRHLYHKSAQT